MDIANTRVQNRKRPISQSRPLTNQGRKPFRFRDFLRTLGPGLITGASETIRQAWNYSQAGAQLGYGHRLGPCC